MIWTGGGWRMADHVRRSRVLALLLECTRTAREIAEELAVDAKYVRNLATSLNLSHCLKPARRGNFAQVIALMDGTRTAREVAAATGVPLQTVYQAARKAGGSMALKSAKGKAAGRHGLAHYLKLSPEVESWLLAQCGPGVSAADLVRSVLVDAWVSDQEGAADNER